MKTKLLPLTALLVVVSFLSIDKASAEYPPCSGLLCNTNPNQSTQCVCPPNTYPEGRGTDCANWRLDCYFL